METYRIQKGQLNKKTLDIGCGSLTASVWEDGTVHTMNAYHPIQGYMTLSSLASFPNGKWFDSEFVRSYRRKIAGLDVSHHQRGIGFVHDVDVKDWEGGYDQKGKLNLRYQLNGFQLTISFETIQDAERSYLLQSIELLNESDNEQVFPFRIEGNLNLNRCSYGQLTEGGPILLPEPVNDWQAEGHRIVLSNPNLAACAELFIYEDGRPLQLQEGRGESTLPIRYTSEQQLVMKSRETKRIHLLYTLQAQAQPLDDSFSQAKAIISSIQSISHLQEPLLIGTNHTATPVEFNDNSWSEWIIRRNADYILTNCSVPVSDEWVCVITDHQLLPLAWNRDAYYMIKLLMEADTKTEYLKGWDRQHIVNTVKGHLLWMFEAAERTHGYWGRAYLAGGRCKDNVFQLDQQCYPLLELCEYYEWTHDRDTIQRILPKIADLWATLLEYKHSECWLFQTGETPADDKVDYPYHFSSQILMWRTLKKLEQLNREFKFMDENIGQWAQSVHDDCMKHFTVNCDEKVQFAYLSDLKGNYKVYHDANDLPTILAPFWEFCEFDDSRWLNTLKFAFSPNNVGGFYQGAFGGLGSVHTPHPWPLGDAQELIYRASTNDREQYDRVLTKLRTICQWDGLFSEAVDEETGTVESRHWFSWPGAFIAQVLIMAQGNGMFRK
ncbi:hypothetical protein SAMN03159341_109171 [Paenibacillus sp. 1_12]|uniref:glycoside hydrolase family 125 protein n=1 Tax=Paenibacillus sp. 1_12 TaxID=1566278 RepID=UPI0008F0C3C5|nr:glycoside hydrolase family 125 protein [Paenibacillus sp. 1_12]SFL75812.1 hypothetical protein SAMN03159341_109171 [Paenibacillus sp. 1_12]